MFKEYDKFTYPQFAIRAADYRERAKNELLIPEMRKAYNDIAGHLDRAAAVKLGMLPAFYEELNSTDVHPGGFARGMAAEYVDQVIDEINGTTHFPN